MRNVNITGKYKIFCYALLSSLFFCACGRDAAPSQESTVALTETEAETRESRETEETQTLPDLSNARNADEVLELLIADEGFRERVRRSSELRIADESSAETILKEIKNCESIVLREAVYGNPIYSLESLSLFPNLKQLAIDISKWDDSTIADFTPIAQLSQLEEIYINYGKEEQIDLSFLGEMHTVTNLYLTHCNIADLSFLEQMPQLQRLSLYETPVEDLAVLEKLPELVELALSGNENAKHIEAVGTLTKMQDLGIQYCGIEDISFLSGLTELRGVNLNGNSVTDITPLAGLVKMERLGLAENKISDISAIGELSSLFDLALDGNEIQDISVLARLPHLNQAGLSDNQIEDFSPLAGKEELMYAAVFGNPAKSIKPVWEVPMLLYTDTGVSDEEETWIADWLKENYPEMEEFECIDCVQGDLNDDGRQDIAFVVDSDYFDVHEEAYPERISDDRCLFVLLQQKDGSWREIENVPRLPNSTAGGMRGDPYQGAFLEPGYLLIKTGWGSSSGTVETEIYEYQGGGFRRVKTISADDYSYADGYDVLVEEEQTDTWKRYMIAMDGYRMVRVDVADSDNPVHKAFPELALFDMSYYIYRDKIETQITASEALDIVCAATVEDSGSVIQEKLPYADWQKEGYELLTGITLPEYYYVLPETRSEADNESGEWEGDYIYYDNIVRKADGMLYHVIYLKQENKSRKMLLNDTTGEIEEI
ncbi:MAG: hypothetical protein K2G55_21005 [Lachnospiraceae bacterium]|nr:hypothetical protein [Lachnospiraceae bacterium]MDE7202950.1 hypothetical protein [Lachnospiraceae bacterium]